MKTSVGSWSRDKENGREKELKQEEKKSVWRCGRKREREKELRA